MIEKCDDTYKLTTQNYGNAFDYFLNLENVLIHYVKYNFYVPLQVRRRIKRMVWVKTSHRTTMIAADYFFKRN